MKKLLALTLFLFFSTVSLAQTYDFLDPKLKRLTSQRGIQINPQALEAYHTNGDKVAKSDVMLYFMKVEFQPAIYADANNQPKVIVFEEASEEAKMAKIKMYENMKSGDFMLKEKAPDFTLVDMDGRELDLKEFRGQYVLLNFWFVGCKPCIMEMPELNELVEEFKPQGINFLAIGLDSPERVKTFLKQHEFNYTLLPNGRNVATNYGVMSYPTHLLLDTEGKVIYSQQGYFPGLKYTLRKRLQDILEN